MVVPFSTSLALAVFFIQLLESVASQAISIAVGAQIFVIDLRTDDESC